MSFWATNGLFIFPQLGLVLCSTNTPVPSPQGGGRSPGDWRVGSPSTPAGGRSCPQLSPVPHSWSGTKTVWGRMPPSTYWGSPALEQDDKGSHSHPHLPVAGSLFSRPASPSMGLCSVGFVPGPCCKPGPRGPRAWAVQVVREGALGNGLWRECQACSSPTSQPTASLPTGRSGWRAQVIEWRWGQSALLSYTGRLCAGWRVCARQSGCKDRKKAAVQLRSLGT